MNKTTTINNNLGKLQRVSQGFTLIELLVATIISAAVISAASYGLMAMMQGNARHEERSQRKTELTRAIAYISEDVRMANRIEEVPVGSTLPTGATGVFMLTIPDDPATDDPQLPGADPTEYQVVYFVKESTATWLPPNTIYRAKNDYSGGVNIATVSAAGVNELVDAIKDPDSPPTCDSGTLTGGDGFYACVDDNTVVLNLFGNFCDSRDYNCDDTRTFPASTTVSTRSTPLVTPSPSPSPSP